MKFKIVSGCDDIIRQHKAACLRITSLLACKDLLWVGTSAGVILTMPLPHVPATASKITSSLNVTGKFISLVKFFILLLLNF